MGYMESSMRENGMMNIHVGDRVLLEFSTFGDRFISVVTVIGDDGRLFVHAPVTPPIIERLKTDTAAQVRFADQGRLIGFKTIVLNRVESANSIIELAGPSAFFDAEERTEPRCPCRFPAIISANGHALRCVVEDMSASCTRVRLLDNGGQSPFVSGEQLTLTFHPFDVSEGYKVGCIMRNVFTREGAVHMLLEFGRADKGMRTRIASFVDAQMACGIPRI